MGSLRIKHSGQVFTPDYLVADILDFCGYVESPRILGKHIIDNSCGEGAFLCEIVGRYCRAFREGMMISLSLKTNCRHIYMG